MAEPRILMLPFQCLESSFSQSCKRAETSMTLACITQDIPKDTKDRCLEFEKIHIVIIKNPWKGVRKTARFIERCEYKLLA
jgi:hypothetical protein